MKKIRGLYLAILLLLLTVQGEAQKSKVSYRIPSETTGFLLAGANGNSYVSVNPVTNREYITYLCWLYRVYKDYPEEFFRAFPCIGKMDLSSVIGDEFNPPDDFSKIIASSDLTSKYIFNPKYLDYPVMGLTWSQCMNYLAWITDRYNEQALIRNKELYDDPNQFDENIFNLEAYISGQYEGVVRKLRINKKTGEERRTEWTDRVYFPAFRLPTESELKEKKTSIKTALVPYKPNPFLELWMKGTFIVMKDSTVMDIYNTGSVEEGVVLKPVNTSLPGIKAEAEFTFECVLHKQISDISEIYSDLGQKVLDGEELTRAMTEQKNNLGFMKFIIIGEDKDSNPVMVPRIRYDQSIDSPVNTIFRYSVNAVR